MRLEVNGSSFLIVGAVGLLWVASALAGEAMAEPQAMNPIEQILRGDERLAAVLEQAEEHRLQVLLGVVEEGPSGPRLVQHAFRVDAEYFYPASSIKLCAAVAAFEMLDAFNEATGLEVGLRTSLVYHPLFADEVLEEADPSNLDGGKITLGHEIRKLFLVSDNMAFNRLYELLGADRLNGYMSRAGLGSARIVHRLAEARTLAENLQTPLIELHGEGFRHSLPGRFVNLPGMSVQGELPIGRAFMKGDKRVEEPMDFSGKNRMSLADLQLALVKVARPDVEVGGTPFRLREPQRAFLLEAMSELPRESKNPRYDPKEYPDHYVKFLLPGLGRVVPKSRLKVYNKIGRAYGFSVENAYVVDTETGNSFFLAAVLYTNENGVLNDNDYEYEEIADPFLSNLGEAVARALWGGTGGR